MDTRAEMETELIARLQVASNSSLFPSSRITTLIQNAYKWATNLFIWPELVRAKCTSTIANAEYYDYPSEFRTGTIIRLEIDGDPYDRKDYEDYMDYKENNPNTTKKMFANYGRFFFVNPTPSSNGSNNIDVWGAIQADVLDDSTDETIFTNSSPEGNEAVVERGFAIAMKRIDSAVSKSSNDEATIILGKLNMDAWKSTHRDKRLDHPRFNVPNFFGNDRSPGVGKFSYQP